MTKKSQQQAAIRQVLNGLNRPATPQEILKIAAEQVPGLGLATVYRCLGRLLESGEARKVEVAGIPPHYERTSPHPHHFFVCKTCEKMFDLHGCTGGFQKLIPPGFCMTSHEIVIYGACKDCAEVNTDVDVSAHLKQTKLGQSCCEAHTHEQT